jgi:flagellar P-ring protein precursor FlgI
MFGADNQVYAVAQGALAVGGFTGGTGGAGGASVTKNHPTVGVIVNGALVEREIPATIVQNNAIELLLRDPGYTTAARLAAAVNEKFPDSAQAIDATSIKVLLPSGAETRVVDFIARVEGIEVYPDTPARVIINERTGTIVATARIKISQCAISHGNLVISISSTPEASQPNALSNTGETAVLNRTKTQVDEPKTGMVNLPDLPTVEKVATALNGLGVSPRDMMAIFQAMKQAGALQAELLIR